MSETEKECEEWLIANDYWLPLDDVSVSSGELIEREEQKAIWLAGFATAHKWVPASERLPEVDSKGNHYKQILCFGISGKDKYEWKDKNGDDYPLGPHVWIGNFQANYGFLHSGFYNCDVIHWQPLPRHRRRRGE